MYVETHAVDYTFKAGSWHIFMLMI